MSSHAPSTHHHDGQDFREEAARLKFLLERQNERTRELMSEVDSLKYDNMRLRKLNAELLAAKRASSFTKVQPLKAQVDFLSQARTAALAQPELGGEEKESGKPNVLALAKTSGDLIPSTVASKPEESEDPDGPPPFPEDLWDSVYDREKDPGLHETTGAKNNPRLENVSIQQTGASPPVGSGKKQDTSSGSSISRSAVPRFPQTAKGTFLQRVEDPWAAEFRASVKAAPHATPAANAPAPVPNAFIDALNKHKRELQEQTDASHSGEPSSDSDQTDYPAKKRRRN